ncbi:MAG: hypothetical protein HY420_05330 [Candidatus Kerfeldbacteria bacterium]|nr:hypothetical protein [Candidatus Kerfeldbacteria bacterium]
MRNWIDPFSLPEELHPRPGDCEEKKTPEESKFELDLGTSNRVQKEKLKPAVRKRGWRMIFWR